MSDTRTIRDVLTEQIGYGTVPDGPSLIKRLADKYATTLGLDPDTVLERMCETCEGRGTIDTSIHKPHVTIRQADTCPDCDGSGWMTVNRIAVIAEGGLITVLSPDDRRALRIGRAVLASQRGGSDDDQSVQDFMAHLLAAGDDE